MPIHVGNNNVIPAGIDKVYVGSNLVYQKAPAPTECAIEIYNRNPYDGDDIQVWVNNYYQDLYGGEGLSGTETNPLDMKFKAARGCQIYINGEAYAAHEDSQGRKLVPITASRIYGEFRTGATSIRLDLTVTY